ncbi:hypothetical protein XENOCAPTIV_027677 [Xenoophorus captivus]|uniref:Uncharacterized protein n=1 Tax=Xenoophorus captivus TaxID=1517983 RepID=A0ABV0QEU1_9TELE
MPNTFYFSDHNYLMMELLVSQPPLCTHDLAVNNLARGAKKVGPLKQQILSNSGGRTQSLFHPNFKIHPLLTHCFSGGLSPNELKSSPIFESINPHGHLSPRQHGIKLLPFHLIRVS